MPKRPARAAKSESEARAAITGAAVEQLLAGSVSRMTLESVASAAHCAKGLVHYHFKTKDNLVAAAAGVIWERRAQEWCEVLGGPDPAAGIRAGWSLITREGASGVCMASAALGTEASDIVVRTVSASRRNFTTRLEGALETLFGHLGLRSSVPISEVALLMGAVIDGLGLQLASGAAADAVEPAWHAFWVGVLSLTRAV